MNYYLVEIRSKAVLDIKFYQLAKADDEKQALKKVTKLFKKAEFVVHILKTIE